MAETRRKFLNALIGTGLVGWLASVLYPVFSFLKPPELPEATVSSLKWGAATDFPSGTSEIIKFGRSPVLLIRLDSGEFKAFEATCTHLDCTVQFRSEKKDIWCACHNGVYDLRGLNVSGPPPRPLSQYAVNIVDGEVFVAKAEA